MQYQHNETLKRFRKVSINYTDNPLELQIFNRNIYTERKMTLQN